MCILERWQLKTFALWECLVPIAFKRATALEDGSQRGSHAIESNIDDEAFIEQVEFAHRGRRNDEAQKQCSDLGYTGEEFVQHLLNVKHHESYMCLSET